MRHATSTALVVLVAGLAAGNSLAQARIRAQPVGEQQEATPQAQEERAAAPQPKAKPGDKPPQAHQRRRPVEQDVQRVTPIPQAQGPSYGPVLTPGARPSPLPSPAPSAGLPPPAQVNSCNGNVCTDASGNIYHQGVGNAAVNSEGRLCNRVGTTMQCF